MEIVIYIIAFIFLYYGLQIGLLYYGFGNVLKFTSKNEKVDTKFSIVIPFRDEAHNLKDFLESVSKLNYDVANFELIFVNDASTDNSLQIINSWRFKNPYVQLTILDNVIMSNSPKKDAITRAITIAKFDWIFVTDADCILPTQLLQINAEYLIANPDKEFVIGGVAIKTDTTFLSKYQSLDMASLQAVTIGSFGIEEAFMCNGANLLYSKNLFNKVNGFVGVNTISSGDDVFLLQKVKQIYPNKIGYLLNPDAIVFTKPVKTLTEVVNQRSRWGKKATAYKSLYPKILGVITILANLGLLVLLVIPFFSFMNIYFILITLLFKLLIDYVFLFKYSKSCKVSITYFLLSFISYPFVLLLIIFTSLFGKLHWKYRSI